MFEYKCMLSRVVDGDTVDLWVDLGFNIRVHERFRLAMINAPESRTKDLVEKKKGIAASEYLHDLLTSPEAAFMKVRTEKDKKGKFGRWIGTLYIGEANNFGPPTDNDWMEVNTLMVTNGHAVFKDY